MKNYILTGVICLAVAVPAGATVLHLELPANYSADMVLDPAPGDEAKLNEFSFDELAKLKEPDGIYVVVFTKNGEGLFRDKPGEPQDSNPPYFGELEFVRSADGEEGRRGVGRRRRGQRRGGLRAAVEPGNDERRGQEEAGVRVIPVSEQRIPGGARAALFY